MADELRKKAVEMLLNGATLLADPCPYCKGVRVMQDGHALCVGCGREPKEAEKAKVQKEDPVKSLEKKLQALSQELGQETDHKKQQDILKSMDSLVGVINKMRQKPA